MAAFDSNSLDSSYNRKQLTHTMMAMVVSLVLASALSVFPVDLVLVNLRPLFMFVVMLFWVVHRPEWFGAWFAFSVGIISDFLLDTQVGQQAFSAVLATFVLQYITRDSRQIHDIQVWLLAALAIVVFNVTLLALQYMDGQVIIWRNGLPMLTTILTWPIVAFVLRRF